MRATSYHFYLKLLRIFLWRGKLVGEENLPQKGPAVMVSNHLDSTGPIACLCSIPRRLFPWSVGDMLDLEKAPAYMNKDFTERELHLKPPLSNWLSYLLTRLTVPMLKSLGCIPVHQGNYARMQETLSLSMDVLRRGGFVIIFPKGQSVLEDKNTGICPFEHTFARLGEMVFGETGERLAFHPVAVHPQGFVQVGKAELYAPENPAGVERRRLKGVMETAVREMYARLEEENSPPLKFTP
jgi:hypothetical protein